MTSKEIIQEQLQAILAANGGRLTPAAIVDAARDPSSMLHDLFEWDDTVAAEKYRNYQARKLITTVEIRIQHEHHVISAPCYVRDPDANAKEQGYVAVAELRKDSDAARVALVNEFQRAADILRRAKHTAIALGMSSEIDEAIERFVELRKMAEHRPGTA